MTALRIATRRSDLAMAQAGIVRLLLKDLGRDAVLCRSTPLVTLAGIEGGAGDRKDRWIDAIVELLRTGQADLAVHSAKDLPADDPEDLVIAAVPERGDPRDVLVAADGAYFDGDGAPARRPRRDLVAPTRGAAPRDLPRGGDRRPPRERADPPPQAAPPTAAPTSRCWLRPGSTGSSLQPAGLKPLPVDVLVPAPGQGTLAIQCRTDDRPLRAALSVLEHGVSATTLHAERALTRALAGDCNLPLGAFAQVHGDVVHLAACVATPDGSRVVRATVEATDAEQAAKEVTAQLLDLGAGEILDAVRAR